jgi:hypothetical protein
VKRHKYGAVKTVVDGIMFASKKEAKRYQELRLLEKAKQIRALELQPVFKLMVGEHQIGKYVADFGYWDVIAARTVYEDAKGFKTPMYRWKVKHVAAQYGIKVVEV